MAKKMDDSFADAALQFLEDNVDRLVVTSTEPANYAGVAALTLAAVAIDATDFTIANGDTSGRKTTVAAQNGVSVTASGTAGHICLVDDGASNLRYVTTCTSQVLTSGNTVNVPAWDIEIADPT